MRWSAFAFLMLLALPAWAEATHAPTAMTPSPDDRARQWLTLIDDGNFADAHKQMAAAARQKNPVQSWTQKIQTMRAPMGAMSSRTLKDVKLTKNRPGMRDGQIAAVRYDAVFAHKAAAIESIFLISENGSWAVTDYTVN